MIFLLLAKAVPHMQQLFVVIAQELSSTTRLSA